MRAKISRTVMIDALKEVKLIKKHKEILHDVYVNNLSVSQIADKYKLVKSTIYYRVRQAEEAFNTAIERCDLSSDLNKKLNNYKKFL